MPLDAASLLALAAVCAPDVAPPTLLAIARVESRLDPLAIGVNGSAARPPPARRREDAIRTATSLIAQGANIDLGLAQINSSNLTRLGLTVSEAFEPCANLRAAGQVLTSGYRRASASADRQARLRTALSIYNTGHPTRGVRNGYVAKVTAAAGVREPLPQAAPPAPTADRPRWQVFASAPAGARPFVLSLQPGDRP